MNQQVRFAALVMAVALGACSQVSASPQPNSRDTEFGTRGDALRVACLNEAEWSTKEKARRRPFNTHHVTVLATDETLRLKAICRELTDLRAINGASDSRRKQAELVKQCGLVGRGATAAQEAHAARMAGACARLAASAAD